MTRLIDADALYEHTHYDDFETLIVDYEDIKNAPTVDAVLVVRCWECRWFDISEPSGTIEPIFFKCKRRGRFVEYDDFCKYGEKMEE